MLKGFRKAVFARIFVCPNIAVAVRPNFSFAVAEDNFFQTEAGRVIIDVKTTSEKVSVQEEKYMSLKMLSYVIYTYS